MKVFKILWIDDAEAWVNAIQDNLDIVANNNFKFKFINQRNGEDIKNQCRIYDFDMILMDYDMVPFTGDKYIKDVREESHLESIPIIFYSQNNSISLDSLVKELKNITTAYRPSLEDTIIQYLRARSYFNTGSTHS
jgi:DNA-binding response OmpR family regulator